MTGYFCGGTMATTIHRDDRPTTSTKSGGTSVNPTAALRESLAKAFPGVPDGLLDRFLGIKKLEELWDHVASGNETIFHRLIEALGITVRVTAVDLRKIPSVGPAIVVSNHPHGILDGIALGYALDNVRRDVKILTNSVLAAIPELANKIIPVDTFRYQGQHVNSNALRQSIKWLEAGGLIAVFPAGEVSRLAFPWSVKDRKWNGHFNKMAARTGARIVPTFISGSNSPLFHLASFVHPTCGTALLIRELIRKAGSTVTIRFGHSVAAENAARLSAQTDATAHARFRSEILTTQFVSDSATTVAQQRPIVSAGDSQLLERDIRHLPSQARLCSVGDLDVYLAEAFEIPNIMKEIGRLREISFRAEGEGTGNPSDIDWFDDHYHHLFAWNPSSSTIVGAYRLRDASGMTLLKTSGLYTTTLFNFPASWWERVSPALELGRSFIRPEYQRTAGSLLSLWRGIGAFLRRNPKYRYLWGPVTISGRYSPVSKALIVSYFMSRRGRANLPLPTPLSPLVISDAVRHLTAGHDWHDLRTEDLDSLVQDIEPDGAGLPVLLRQYVQLGGHILAFNVDRAFSHSLDGLLLIDLLQADERRLQRYFGLGNHRPTKGEGHDSNTFGTTTLKR
jgi:putative hemolysin